MIISNLQYAIDADLTIQSFSLPQEFLEEMKQIDEELELEWQTEEDLDRHNKTTS
jgi:hypothetical protein